MAMCFLREVCCVAEAVRALKFEGHTCTIVLVSEWGLEWNPTVSAWT